MKIPLYLPPAGEVSKSAARTQDVRKNVNGTFLRINYDLTIHLTAEQNRAGKTVQLESREVTVQAVCLPARRLHSQYLIALR